MSGTLLTYTVVANTGNIYTTRDPQNPSLVTLTIGVRNQTAQPITPKYLSFILAVGDGASALTTDPARVTATSNQPDTWAFAGDRKGFFRAVPLPPATGTLQPGESLTFTLDGIPVNTIPGVSAITVTELTGQAPVQDSLLLTKVVSPLNILRFMATPPLIAPGEKAVLSWETQAASSCTLVPQGGPTTVPVTGQLTVKPLQSTVYTLTAAGEGPPLSQVVQVAVSNVQIFSFEASQDQIKPGTPVTLSWQTIGADSCTLDPGAVPLQANGSLPITPSQTTTYTLTASRNDGNQVVHDKKQVTVTVEIPVRINSFQWQTEPCDPAPERTTLYWNTANALRCRITGQNGSQTNGFDVPTIGGLDVTNQDFGWTYTLTAEGNVGQFAQAQLTIGWGQEQGAMQGAPQPSKALAATVLEAPPSDDPITTDPLLLTYTCTPQPYPVYTTRDSTYPSVVELVIAVRNDQTYPVKVTSILFTVPVGESEGTLTTNPSSIIPDVGDESAWQFIPVGGGSFRAVPILPVTGLAPGASTTFTLSHVIVNKEPGLTQIKIVENTGRPLQGGVYLSKVLSPLSINSFSANPDVIKPGQPATLSWSTTAAANVTITPPVSTKPLPTTGQIDVLPMQTTTYTLIAAGEGPPVSHQVTVTVDALDIRRFSAGPVDVAKGGASTLTWDVLYADSVTIDPGAHPVDPSGTRQVTVDQTTTYTLSATQGAVTDQRQLTVTVCPQTIESFTATPNPIPLGTTATLAWSTTYATGCRIDPDVGPVAPSGAMVVKPTQTTTYTLSVDGLRPTVTQSVTVTIQPVSVTAFSVSPNPIPAAGSLATLAWQTSEANSVTIDHGIGPVAVSGQVQVTVPAWTGYTLTAQGYGGPATALVQATLPGGPYEILQVRKPTYINPQIATEIRTWWDPDLEDSFAMGIPREGAYVVIQGSTVNGTYPILTGAPAGNADGTWGPYGSFVILTPWNEANAAGPGGTISISAPPYEPQIAFWNAYPSAITAGQSTTLSWGANWTDSVTITPNVGTYSQEMGRVVVSPTQTTTYTLVATGKGGTDTRQVTVTV